MELRTKPIIIGLLGILFLCSLILVQAMEVARKREEAGLSAAHVSVPFKSQNCILFRGNAD